MVFVQEKRKSGNKSTALEHLPRDGPLENLRRGGEGQKKIAQGKITEQKILARQLILKQYSCYGLKKNSYQEFDNEKKFLPSPLTP